MIIGISGKKQVGKDTIGKIIQSLDWYYNGYKNNIREKYSDIEYITKVINNEILEYSDWQIKKFAGKLKQIVSLLTGIPVEDLEKQEVKDRVLGEEWNEIISYPIFDKEFPDEIIRDDEAVKQITVREFLQRLGTEVIRDVIHPNIWCNALFSEYSTKIDEDFLNMSVEEAKKLGLLKENA